MYADVIQPRKEYQEYCRIKHSCFYITDCRLCPYPCPFDRTIRLPERIPANPLPEWDIPVPMIFPAEQQPRPVYI